MYRIRTPNVWIKSSNSSKSVKNQGAKSFAQNVTFSIKTNFETS